MKARGVRWEGQAERPPFPLPIFHRQLTITIFIGIASGGLSGGDSRVVASLLSTLYFFFTETAPFLWLRQIFSQLKCTPKMGLKIHWQLVKTLRHWLNMGVIFSR